MPPKRVKRPPTPYDPHPDVSPWVEGALRCPFWGCEHKLTGKRRYAKTHLLGAHGIQAHQITDLPDGRTSRGPTRYKDSWYVECPPSKRAALESHLNGYKVGIGRRYKAAKQSSIDNIDTLEDRRADWFEQAVGAHPVSHDFKINESRMPRLFTLLLNLQKHAARPYQGETRWSDPNIKVHAAFDDFLDKLPTSAIVPPPPSGRASRARPPATLASIVFSPTVFASMQPSSILTKPGLEEDHTEQDMERIAEEWEHIVSWYQDGLDKFERAINEVKDKEVERTLAHLQLFFRWREGKVRRFGVVMSKEPGDL